MNLKVVKSKVVARFEKAPRCITRAAYVGHVLEDHEILILTLELDRIAFSNVDLSTMPLNRRPRRIRSKTGRKGERFQE